MTEDTQGSYCPYCGAWNSVTDGKCASCGADLQHSSEEVYSGDTWRIVQDDIVIVPERPVVTEKIEQAPPRSKLLVRALLFVCCFKETLNPHLVYILSFVSYCCVVCFKVFYEAFEYEIVFLAW